MTHCCCFYWYCSCCRCCLELASYHLQSYCSACKVAPLACTDGNWTSVFGSCYSKPWASVAAVGTSCDVSLQGQSLHVYAGLLVQYQGPLQRQRLRRVF